MSELVGPRCMTCGLDWYRHGGMPHEFDRLPAGDAEIDQAYADAGSAMQAMHDLLVWLLAQGCDSHQVAWQMRDELAYEAGYETCALNEGN